MLSGVLPLSWGRSLLANEALFIASAPLRVCMSCSRPVSVTCGSYVPAPGVMSMSSLGAVGACACATFRLRFAVPPNPLAPFLLDVWKELVEAACLDRLW